MTKDPKTYQNTHGNGLGLGGFIDWGAQLDPQQGEYGVGVPFQIQKWSKDKPFGSRPIKG